jgi:antirestriction protein ArdC
MMVKEMFLLLHLNKVSKKDYFMTNQYKDTYKNYVTGDFYTGENHLALNAFFLFGNYTDPRFLTFRQALKVGRVVKKGEKGITLFRPCMVKKKNKETGEITLKKSRKYFSVFNIFQTTELVDTDTAREIA